MALKILIVQIFTSQIAYLELGLMYLCWPHQIKLCLVFIKILKIELQASYEVSATKILDFFNGVLKTYLLLYFILIQCTKNVITALSINQKVVTGYYQKNAFVHKRVHHNPAPTIILFLSNTQGSKCAFYPSLMINIPKILKIRREVSCSVENPSQFKQSMCSTWQDLSSWATQRRSLKGHKCCSWSTAATGTMGRFITVW